MKGKWNIIIPIVILTVIILLFIKKAHDNKEVIQIFQENVGFQIFINIDVENIEDIETKLMNIKNVENVEFYSKEDALRDLKEKFSNSYIFNDYFKDHEDNNNIVPNSFLITIKINNIDDINQDYFKNIENDIMDINGVERITTCYNKFVEIYNEYGINRLKDYVKMLKITDEQGSNGLQDYLEKHQNSRKLLKYMM